MCLMGLPAGTLAPFRRAARSSLGRACRELSPPPPPQQSSPSLVAAVPSGVLTALGSRFQHRTTLPLSVPIFLHGLSPPLSSFPPEPNTLGRRSTPFRDCSNDGCRTTRWATGHRRAKQSGRFRRLPLRTSRRKRPLLYYESIARATAMLCTPEAIC